MQLTPEQQPILDYIQATEGLTLISSIAGSGKTTMLTAIAKAIPHTNGLYLAYNTSVANDSKRKFPSSTHCMTTHSMAYRATVIPLKLSVGFFNYKTITEKIKYETKWEIINSIKAFCLSKFLTYTEYADEYQLPPLYTKIATKYLGLMHSGKIDCTHDFYLKLFHILLHKGEVAYDNFDFIMLDEAGDLNEVTLEIFKLLPSPRKIAVGDPFQNIYTFNYTINCFEVLKDEGTLFQMSQSFRVPNTIATKIEHFCQSYLDSSMSFKGVPLVDPTISTRAYLTRTNSALIHKMIELNQLNIPYGLVRKAKDIFKLPLMLCSLKYQGFITDPGYKFIQADIDDWYEDQLLKDTYKSPIVYLASLYKDDIQLVQAIRLLQRHGKSVILDSYAEARKHEQSSQAYTLATVHSCKGAEFDEVTIANDLNESTADSIKSIKHGLPLSQLSPQERESLNLYYVAVTRTSKELYNATHL